MVVKKKKFFVPRGVFRALWRDLRDGNKIDSKTKGVGKKGRKRKN